MSETVEGRHVTAAARLSHNLSHCQSVPEKRSNKRLNCQKWGKKWEKKWETADKTCAADEKLNISMPKWILCQANEGYSKTLTQYGIVKFDPSLHRAIMACR